MSALWSQATGAAIGIDWLLAATAPASALGRRARAQERAYRRGDEDAARAALERVAAVARACMPGDLAAIGHAIARAPEISAILERARAGDTLGDSDFFELGRFLDALADVAARAQTPAFAEFGALAGGGALRAALAPGRAQTGTFYLADAFDAALASERARTIAAQAALDLERSRARGEAAQLLRVDDLRDGEFTIARDAAANLPPSVRVLREGATYLLCRLEPGDDELFARDERDRLAAAVAQLEEGVRARLSALVADVARELDAARTALGILDLLVARATFAQTYACVVPEIVDDASSSLRDARYLPLAEELLRVGRPYAPISFDLAGIAVVTGPNMGGKTAALRALGFAIACVALGVPVPARAARVPLVDEIVWLGIDAGQPGDALLSSFGREVVALRAALAPQPARALVLVDEFARTTSPREGRALTIALVRAFAARRALGLVATHFGGVARAADVAHFTSGRLGLLAPEAVDGSLDAALARIAQAMEYALVPVIDGEPQSSDALALAEALGLDASLVADARAWL
jgi:hypothetical protein